MGNSLGGKKNAKVMQISGESFKLKTPVQAGEVVKNYPGHVLLKSEEVKHFGVRAKPLEPYQNLEPRGIYFLVELPKVELPKERVPRRVRSGINMSAKDRLETLMLSRRSVSDLSVMKSSSAASANSIVPEEEAREIDGAVRVRMRLPKAQVEKLMKQSRDEAEAAQRIVDLCLVNNNSGGQKASEKTNGNGGFGLNQQTHWKDGAHGRLLGSQGIRSREKRVSFRPDNEGEIQVAVAS
ncbi:uncharacterized protein At1g66480 [Prunus avium]|uniref:Uncharacterized protein At1g66480 n=1 Tax=Prunus avium TaxID=42229 RepID=A0A6P5TAS2_PRUAV|nr:uncharacterized protein At1g66480 [Prunus avium]